MSIQHQINLGTVVISNGGTTSSEVLYRGGFSRCKWVTFLGPAALTGTVNIQGTPDGTNWANIVTIAASAMVSVENKGYQGLRVLSGSAEGAARTFIVSGIEEL